MANACSECKYTHLCPEQNEKDGFEYCLHAADTVVQFIDWRMSVVRSMDLRKKKRG